MPILRDVDRLQPRKLASTPSDKVSELKRTGGKMVWLKEDMLFAVEGLGVDEGKS